MNNYSFEYKGFTISHYAHGRAIISHRDKNIRQCYKELMGLIYKSPHAAKCAITRFDTKHNLTYKGI